MTGELIQDRDWSGRCLSAGAEGPPEPEEALGDFKSLKTGVRNQNSIAFQHAYKNMSKPNKT